MIQLQGRHIVACLPKIGNNQTMDKGSLLKIGLLMCVLKGLWD